MNSSPQAPTARITPEIEHEINQSMQVRALGAMSGYISGRLDAADRRAGLVLSGSAVSFSVIAARLSTEMENLSIAARLLAVFLHPSVWLTVVSVALALLSLWPRKAGGDDWVSQIFLGSETPEAIHRRLSGSSQMLITEFIANQQGLSALVRKKNRLVAWSIPPLLFGILCFAVGL